MKIFQRVLPAFLLLPALAAATTGSFSFAQTFTADDEVQLFDFTLLNSGTVTFQTWGYGGGTNAAGSNITTGGFESLLTWFGSDGSVIGNSASYSCGSGNTYLFDCLDAFANPVLPAGDYTLALTVWQNNSLGTGSPGDLGLGFQYDGQPNFTATGPCTQFCDSQGNQDNGIWAVDIEGVDSAALSAAPEPAAVLLMLCGLAGLAPMRKAARNCGAGGRQ